jgi:small-conductance mechanosensitive channel
MDDILDLEWNGYGLVEVVIAFAVAAAVFITMRYIRSYGLQKLEKLAARIHAKWVHLLIDTLKETKSLLLLIVAVYAGSQVVSLPGDAQEILRKAFIVALFMQAGLWINHFVGAWANDYRERQLKINPGAVTAIGALRLIAQLGLWVLVFLLILDNLGFNIVTLLAGLGIGGVAVALAVQNILGDLFASLSIVIDKTFVIGDSLSVGEVSGTVEYIGLKNTRIRSLTGEQIILSNTDLLNSQIRNYGRLQERRAEFTLMLEFRNDREKLRALSKQVEEVVMRHEKIRFDKARVMAFVESGLRFDCSYYVLSNQYSFYIEQNEKILFEVLELLERQDIEIAYSTRTLRVAPVGGNDDEPRRASPILTDGSALNG